MPDHLTLTAIPHKPWFYYINNDYDNCLGIQCDIIKYLSRSLNFTFKVLLESLPGIGETQSQFVKNLKSIYTRNAGRRYIEELNNL